MSFRPRFHSRRRVPLAERLSQFAIPADNCDRLARTECRHVPPHLKLHLGCGRLGLPGYTNVDIIPPAADVACDVETLDPYADGTVAAIYASHVLEHFGRRRTIEVLRAWWRVLCADGELRIAVPDFEAVVVEVSAGTDISRVAGLVCGGQRDEYDYHKTIFDFATLRRMLECAGFEHVERYDAHEFLGPDVDDYSKSHLPHMDFSGRLMSLNVVCRKTDRPPPPIDEDTKRVIKA